MKKVNIGLIAHEVGDYNLGCSALATANIRLMDSMFEKYNVEVEYTILVIKPRDGDSLPNYALLEGITKNKYTYKAFPRLKDFCKNPFLIRKCDSFNGCDYIVDLCGGDGYTDIYGIVRIIAESIPVYIAYFHNIPVIFAPQTIGPFNTRIGRIISKFTLSKLKKIYVRDDMSLKCCNDININQVTRVIDVAFALPYNKTEHNHDKINIGINVSGLLYNGGFNHNNYFKLTFNYKEFIDRLVGLLSSNDQYRVHLIPHVLDPKHGVDDDWNVCIEVKEKYPNCILPKPFETASDAKSYISGLDLFSGARMHSTIGAISSGVPVIPVAYSRKFNGLYGTLKYSFLIDAKSGISLDDAVDAFFDYLHNIEDLRTGVTIATNIYKNELKKYLDSMPGIFEVL